MFNFNLLNSTTQISTEARKKLLFLILCALLFYCEFKFFISSGGLYLCTFFCIIAIFPESIYHRIFRKKASESRISPVNKAVLITGCDTGFGHEIAKRLASKGFLIFAGCLSTSKNGGEELSSVSNVHCFQMDVSKQDDVEEALQYVANNLEGKQLWAVINNAGIARGIDVAVTPMSKIEEVLGVNLLGTIRVSKTFLNLIRKSKGRIINVASIAGRLMMPGLIPYSLSKMAVIAFSDGLRMEMHKFGVSVVTIEPWMYKTKLSDPSVIGRSIEKEWANSKEDIKDAYSPSYAKEIKRNTSYLFSWFRNPNVFEVIEAMEDAVTSASPPYYYRPGKWYLNVYLWIMGSLPKPFVDYLLCNCFFRAYAAK